MKSGGVTARPRQAVDVSGADRISGHREHNRYGAGGLEQRRHGRVARGHDDVGRERDQFSGLFSNLGGIGRGPADVDAHVSADVPTQQRQLLLEGSNTGLPYRVVR